MGRFDILTEREETQPAVTTQQGSAAPISKPDSGVKKHAPPSRAGKPDGHGIRQHKQPQQTATPPLSLAETVIRPVKPRHGFDIYQDQYETLLGFSNEEKLQGGTGSMSAMAREALDDYIAKRKKH